MPTDRQALSALDDIDRILGQRIGRPLAADECSPNEEELRAEYWEIRKRLDTALILIAKIPVYGRRIATAVRFLMQICDRHCAPPPDIVETAAERAPRASRGGGRLENDDLIVYGHDSHRPRSLRTEASEHHRPSSPGAGDRGLMGLL